MSSAAYSPEPGYRPFVPSSALDDPLRVPDDYRVPTVAELLELPLEARRQQLMLLQSFDSEMGTDHVGAYRRERSRCTDLDEMGRRCADERFPGMAHCLAHATLDELNPSGASERRVRAARMRLVDKLDSAVDQLVGIIEAPGDAVTAQVRLNAITTLMDRGGLPKESRTETHAQVEITDTQTAGATVRARIEQLRAAATQQPADPASPDGGVSPSARNGENPPPELGSGPDGPDVVEGELVT